MTTERRDFTEEEINYAWSRAKVVEDVDQSKWRQDCKHPAPILAV